MPDGDSLGRIRRTSSEVFLFPDGTDYVCLLAYGEGGDLLATHRDSFAFVKHCERAKESARSEEVLMAVVNPLPKEKAAPELHEIYEAMNKKFGKMPNFFATMARRPNVLQTFLPLYAAITGEGTVEQRYKELAYVKTSLVNGCEY